MTTIPIQFHKLDDLGQEKILQKLKLQLTSTVGTKGTRIGYSLPHVIRDFQKDWSESLHDYVRLLKYDALPALLKDLTDILILETEENGTKTVRALTQPSLERCFALIDRTKPRERYRYVPRKMEESASSVYASTLPNFRRWNDGCIPRNSCFHSRLEVFENESNDFSPTSLPSCGGRIRSTRRLSHKQQNSSNSLQAEFLDAMNNDLPTNMTDEKDVHNYFNDVFKSVVQKCGSSSDNVVTDGEAPVKNENEEPQTSLEQKSIGDENINKKSTSFESIGSSSKKDSAKKDVVTVAQILDDCVSIVEKKKEKKEINAKDLMDLIRENGNQLRLSVLQKLFREQFDCDLTCRKLTDILNVSVNIRNHIVAFKSFKWKVFEVPDFTSDPFIAINEAEYQTFCQNSNTEVLSQIPKELVDSWILPLIENNSEDNFLQPNSTETTLPEVKKIVLPEMLKLSREVDVKKSEETDGDNSLNNVDVCLKELKIVEKTTDDNDEFIMKADINDDEITDALSFEKKAVDDTTAAVTVSDNNDEKDSRFSDLSPVNSHGSGCSNISYNTLDNDI